MICSASAIARCDLAAPASASRAARASSIIFCASALALVRISCTALLGFGELLLDLLRVREALGDLLPALFEHVEDRLVGKLLQQERDDAEADDLREEEPPVEAEGLAGRAARYRRGFPRCRLRRRGEECKS